VLLARLNEKQEPISLAQHKLTDVSREEFCKRCHVSSNTVGAPNMVLPSKSFVCIACHYSPLKIGSPFFLIAIIIGILGIVGILGFWLKAGVQNEVSSVHRKIQLGSEVVWSKIFSREILAVLKTIFFDIFLQRRILANGVSRWLIHSFIFYSFFARFALSFYTFLSHKISPEGDWTLILVDRDSSFVATFSDVTGAFILIGVIWALVRRFVTKPEYMLTEEQDTVALLMIGLVTFSGFLLEAMRILVTQIPSEIAVSAFAGYVLSLLLSVFDLNWPSIYGYMWYIHALLWAAFIAYIPFGKLKHILTTPLSLLLNYKKA
jgi:nitrate reductase gamma subunit